jgi:hypothetical protein
MNELIGSPSILKKKTVSLSSSSSNKEPSSTAASVSQQNSSFSAVALAMQNLEDDNNTVVTADLSNNKRVSFGKAPFTAASLKNAVKEKVSLASLRSGSMGGTSSYLRRDGGRSGTSSSTSSGGVLSKECQKLVRDSLQLYLDSSPPSFLAHHKLSSSLSSKVNPQSTCHVVVV